MAADPDFADLLRRVRAGDAQAAARLVKQFEPEIRRYVRVRLTDPACWAREAGHSLTTEFISMKASAAKGKTNPA